TCGKSPERDCVNTAAACSRLATATSMLSLCASASVTSASSAGSPNAFHHSTSAPVTASAGSKRYAFGVSIAGRAYGGANEHADTSTVPASAAPIAQACNARAPRCMVRACMSVGLGRPGGRCAPIAACVIVDAGRTLAFPTLLQPVEDVEEQRHVEHRERRLADHPADDAGADRVARVGARAECQ